MLRFAVLTILLFGCDKLVLVCLPDAGADGRACEDLRPIKCPAGHSICAGRCIDTQHDVANCGACGHYCIDQSTGGDPMLCCAGQCLTGFGCI